MLKLLKSKIEAVSFEGRQGFDALMKLIGISIFVLDDEARGCTPPYKECLKAIAELKEIAAKQAGNTELEFNTLKRNVLTIINSVIEFFSASGLDGPSMMDLLTGAGEIRRMQQAEIKFALLMVEQDNIDFFQTRTSHLPSQPHDRLYSHYWARTENNIATFGFWENSGLPDSIKNEAISAIQEVVKKYT